MDKSQNLSSPTQNLFGLTNINVIKYSFEWKISNFSLNGKNIGEYLRSPKFSSPSNKNIKWSLILFPKGQYAKDKDHMSIFLCLRLFQGFSKIETNLQFFILNRHKKKCFEYAGAYTFTEVSSVGILQYVQRSAVMNSTFMPNDCLTIVCNITASLNSITLQSCSVIENAITDQKPEFKLLNNYESFLNDQKLCDVTIIISGKRLHAHKLILAIHSPVFLAMFNNDMRESQQNVIEITDIKFIVFQELLRFIYSGKIENMDSIANDLLVAADKYLINGLMIMCEQYLQSMLNLDNIMDVLVLADNYNAANLKQSAIQFLISHRKDIANVNDFKFLDMLKPDTVKEIAKSLAMV